MDDGSTLHPFQGQEELIPFEFPVSLAFANDHTMYVSERFTGRIFEVNGPNRKLVIQFQGPILEMHNETGTLGLAIPPDFSINHSLYVYHTVQEFQAPWHNRISRVNVDTGQETAVIADLPAGQLHNGGVMAFGPDGKLYVGIGEFMKPPLAQIKEYPAGKVLRMNPDGSVPDDNPFPGSPTYSYGHRNVFGLAFHPTTKQLFMCDIGTDQDDEINIVHKGGNYGWPIVLGHAHRPEYIDPIYVFRTPVTPTQCAFANERELYVGSYNFGEVYRFTLDGPEFTHIAKHEVIYASRPFGILGTFVSPTQELYVTRPEGVTRIKPQAPQLYDRAVA